MIKGSGYYFNGKDYIACHQGKQIGAFATASQAWKAIGRKAWR